MRAAKQGSEILGADNQTGQYRVVAQIVMHKPRQHRQRQADGQVTNEGEHHDRQNTFIQLEMVFFGTDCGHRRWLASNGVSNSAQHTPMGSDDKCESYNELLFNYAFVACAIRSD
ncbi:hypothetical protein D3C81_1181090 [compost metagenome]